MNKNKEIRIEKVTLNIGAGGSAELVNKGLKLLQAITGIKPVKTVTTKRIPTWGVRPGLATGCKVTVRGKKAEELLKRLLKAKESRLLGRNFDNQGNFSFGIKEYLDIPNVKYDHEIGIMGLDTAVTLQRAGFRVKNRRLEPKKLPPKDRKFGLGSRKCNRCGRYKGHIRKYGLDICRQCFRDIAKQIGFKKYS